MPSAQGRLSIEEKFALCQQVFAEAQLPLIFRITPMSEPQTLDSWLEVRRLRVLEDTRVMVNGDLSIAHTLSAAAGHQPAAGADIPPSRRSSARCVARRCRNSRPSAQRLELSPVPFEGWVLRRSGESVVIACGQTAAEADMVGLYDVFTASDARNSGWARKLCAQLLRARTATWRSRGYLQVDASNLPARSVYRRLALTMPTLYHYRTDARQIE